MNNTIYGGGMRIGSRLIWLAYCMFLFIDPILEPRRNVWIGTVAVFLAFLPLYLLFIGRCKKPTQFLIILAILGLGIITVPWNSGGTTFFIYVAAFLPFAIASVPWILAGFCVEILILCAEARWIHTAGLHISWFGVAFNSAILLIVGASNIFYAQQRRTEAKLRLAHEEIEELAAVAERERIARDLHDVLGHTLSLIVLKSELAGRLLDQSTPESAARARNEIGEVERTARTALAEVREAIGGYRSRGFAAEIESAGRALRAAGVEFRIETSDVASARLTAAEETVLSLALREAVTNIVRHAHARTCRLRFVTEDGTRRLIIEDDGQHVAAREGNGLRGMRERIEGLGGRFALHREQGTRLELHLPGEPSRA